MGCLLVSGLHFESFYSSIMAARRVSSTAIDWVAFGKKIPASQKTSFAAFKQKHDGYLRAVNSFPEAAPKIDFGVYKDKIAVAGMVEDFQKKYEALQVPYPKDSLSSTIDQQGAQKKSEYENLWQIPRLKLTPSILNWPNGQQ